MKNRGMKLGSQTGSFFNHLMSYNDSVPEVGKGATILYWTDRHAYEVIEVDEDKKKVVIQKYAPNMPKGMKGPNYGQIYEYKELTNEKMTLYYKWGSWKYKILKVVFTDEAKKKYEMGPKLHEAYKAAGGEYTDCFVGTIIPGFTKQITEWCSVNVLFGTKEEYYDYSF
jgi:hypothetical protein